MKSALIVFGFLFLIDPNVLSIDFLPDVIGLFLISKGLFRLSLLDAHVEKARNTVHALMIASGVRFLLMFTLVSTRFQSNRLLSSFIMATAEIILYTVFVKSLFDGLESLGVRHDGKGVFQGGDVCRVMLQVFFIVRALLELAPNTVILFYPEVDAEPGTVQGYGFLSAEYYSVRNWTLVFCVAATLVFGIYVATQVFAYRKRILKDTAFCEKLGEIYRVHVLEDETVSLRVALRRASSDLLAAPLFLAPFYFEKMAIVPRALFFVFLLLAIRAVPKYLPMPRWQKILLWAGVAVNAAEYIYRLILVSVAYDFDREFLLETPLEILNFVAAAFVLYGGAILLLSFFRLFRQFFSYLSRNKHFVVFAAAAAMTALGVYYEYFAPWNGVLLFTRWALFAVLMFAQKMAVDQFREEIDRKLV